MTPQQELHELIKARGDEVATIRHGWRAGPYIQQVVEAFNRYREDAKDIRLKEDLGLSERKFIVLGYQGQEIATFEMT